MRSVAPVLALAFLLAGCYGHCGTSYDELRWTEPGLYASIDGTEPLLSTWSPGRGALPWNGSAWAEPPSLAGVRLAEVGYDPPKPPATQRGMFLDIAEDHVEAATVERDGWLTLTTIGEPPEAALRAVFDAVLANATEGLDADALWSDLLRSKQDTGMRMAFPTDGNMTAYDEKVRWSYDADLRGHLRLDALAADLGLAPPAAWGFGGSSSAAGRWTYTFSLPTWTVQADPGQLRVDSADNAYFDGASFGTAEELKAAAAGTLARLGREAHLDGADASGSSC